MIREDEMKDLSDAVVRLQEVVATSGLVEMNKLVHSTIETLKERTPYGEFDDTLVRHLWDEYCWNYQEGADLLDEPFDDLLAAFVDKALNQLGTHALICMTAYSHEQLGSDFYDEEPEPGSIDKEVIRHVCMDKIRVAAGIRNLDIIGYKRPFVIREYVTADGPVFSKYNADNLAPHINVLLDPDGNLDPIAEEIAYTFLSDLYEDTDLDEFLDYYCDEVTTMIKNKEIIPELENVRRELLADLDG
jgi:hypothetical protein